MGFYEQGLNDHEVVVPSIWLCEQTLSNFFATSPRKTLSW